MRIPVATYRLQLRAGPDLHEASGLVDYLRALGVTDVYLSPVFAARTGSAHGYDVVDPTRVDPALGGEAAFDELCSRLRKQDMGLLLDIVPNHMAASHENPWWWDVLEKGRASPHAGVFDVDWEVGDGKVVLPVLGGPYAEILEAGELVVVKAGRRLELRYHDRRFPLDPDSYRGMRGSLDAKARTLNGRPGDPGSFDRLDDLLDAQHYRLASWRTSGHEIGYRRFFDITELVSVRVEDPEVFDATHALIVKLVRAGRVTGLRVDHVDGLHDPRTYLARLRTATDGAYVLVEKILDRHEDLPPDWDTAGTTGYEFLNALGGLFVDPRGVKRFLRTAEDALGDDTPFPEVVHGRKRLVLERLFGGEVRALTRRLETLAARDRHGRDLDPAALREALVEVTACLDVYRTYVSERAIRPADRERIEATIEKARARLEGREPALDFLRSVLLLEGPGTEERLAFVMRWQQLTGPAMAKGFEDTALYAYVRLASRNDVGGDPGEPAVDPEELHALNTRRAHTWPHAMTTTSTHDTKRSEDVRARIDILSEIPETWAEHLARWRRWNGTRKTVVDGREVPGAAEELLLYQTILGAWPIDRRDVKDFPRRIREYVVKAAREAKVHTSWRDPDERHERALQRFAVSILSPRQTRFRKDLLRLERIVAYHGMLNALGQVAGKLASPGVPDLYQGSELWHLALVDPDNRRPVDFSRRRDLLDELSAREPSPELATELLETWTDGRIKLHVTHRALRHRLDHPELYLDGAYIPLRARGASKDHVVAFARRRRRAWVVCVFPRFTTRLAGVGEPPLGSHAWGVTRLPLPVRAPQRWRNLFTGEEMETRSGALALTDVFRSFPVALLEPTRRDHARRVQRDADRHRDIRRR